MNWGCLVALCLCIHLLCIASDYVLISMCYLLGDVIHPLLLMMQVLYNF